MNVITKFNTGIRSKHSNIISLESIKNLFNIFTNTWILNNFPEQLNAYKKKQIYVSQ